MVIIYAYNNSPVYASDQVESSKTIKKITYDDLILLLKTKNEIIKAATLENKAQKERVGFLKRSFVPKLSAEVGREEFKSGNQKYTAENYWKVGAQLNLFKSGQDSLENEIRAQNEKISAVNSEMYSKNELKEAQQAYWNAIGLNQQITDTLEAIQKNKTNLLAAKSRIRAGLATNIDLVQFELHQVMLERNIKKLELDKDLTLNKLSVALALEEHENIEIIGSFPLPTNQQFEHTLLIEKQSELSSLQLQQKTELIKSKQNSRWWWPQLDVYSQYAVPTLSDDHVKSAVQEQEWTTGVKLTLDFGLGFEKNAEATARKFEAESIQLKLNHRKREIIAKDHELKHDLKVLKELILQADQDIALAEKFLKLTESEYKKGVRSGPDLLEAFKNFFEFKERKTEYYKDYYETLAELDSIN